MAAGRKPKPPELKVLQNNPGKRSIPTNYAKSARPIGDPPDWFSEEHVAVWEAAVDAAPPGMLTYLDRSILTVWVHAVVDYQKAAEAVERSGMVVKAQSSGQPMQNPYMPIKNKQAEIIKQTGSELGFTPSSRSKVIASASEGQKQSKFSDAPKFHAKGD